MLKKLLLLFIGCLFAMAGNSQTFYFPDPIIYVDKTTSHISIHHYGEIHNWMAQDQPMRWRVNLSTLPPNWDYSIDDPSNGFTYINHNDSADFILTDSTGLAFPEKMIIGVYHDGTPGGGDMVYTIWPQGSPQDSMQLTFRITVVEATAIDERAKPNQLLAEVSPGVFQLPTGVEEVTVYDLQGRSVYTLRDAARTNRLHLGHLPKGIYVVHYSLNGTVIPQKVVRR